MRFHYIWKFRWPHKTVAAGGGWWSERLTLPDPLFYISVRVAQSFVFCALFCRLFFAIFPLVIALSLLQFTASDYRFGRSFNLLLLTTALVGPSIYCFWLPHWSVLQSSDYLFGQSFNLLLLTTSLVSLSIYWFWLPLCSVLQFTASNYRFGRSSIYCFWLPLWSVLQFTASDYLFGIFRLFYP